MGTVRVTEARQNFRELIRRVEMGEEIVLTRRGTEVARLVPVRRDREALPSLERFRASVQIDRPLSEAVTGAREEERR